MGPFQQRLFERINYEQTVKSGQQHFKLNGMRELLRRLGQPHLKYPVIHVAGTKGKGSVSTLTGSILTHAGKKTGVYTSPHLESLHQRMAINGMAISDQDLEHVLSEVFAVVDQMDRELLAPVAEARGAMTSGEIQPGPAPYPERSVPGLEADNFSSPIKPITFFEITTAAAMLYFAQQQCQAVVLEVGLGGRLDSTNVCQPRVCVITNISLDHTRQLGSSIDLIAFEKAGIIKPQVPVVSGVLKPEAAQVIEQVAREREAPLKRLGHDFQIDHQPTSFAYADESLGQTIGDLRLKLLGRYQRTNAALAIAAVRLFDEQVGKDGDVIRQGLADAFLPGRTELACQQPVVLLDIAHNEASVSALVETLEMEFPRSGQGKRVLLFGTSRDKPHRKLLDILAPCFDQIIVTRYQLNPRGRDTGTLVEALNAVGLAARVQVGATPPEAWELATRQLDVDDLLCITGSAFLVAELAATARGWANEAGRTRSTE